MTRLRLEYGPQLPCAPKLAGLQGGQPRLRRQAASRCPTSPGLCPTSVGVHFQTPGYSPTLTVTARHPQNFGTLRHSSAARHLWVSWAISVY